MGATAWVTSSWEMTRLTGKMKILYCIILNAHTHTNTCFQNIVFSISLSHSLYLSLCLDIMSIRVCSLYLHTHTFSVYASLSCVYECDRGRGVPSLSMCVCVYVWVIDVGRRVWVSWNSWHHIFEPICRTAPERKGSREIWNCNFTNTLLTHSETIHA